jgi:hypothetical protein
VSHRPYPSPDRADPQAHPQERRSTEQDTRRPQSLLVRAYLEASAKQAVMLGQILTGTYTGRMP